MESQEIFTEPITGIKYRIDNSLNDAIVRTTSGKLEESENILIDIEHIQPQN